MDPEQALALVMAQMVYDVNDDATGVFSSLRGHSLARLMYGLNDGNPPLLPPDNTHAYNGTGALHYNVAPFGTLVDDFTMVNYQYFQADGFLRDPERYEAPPRGGLGAPKGTYTGGANAPYTYPDRNNMLLAAIRADGTQLAVSGMRPYLFYNAKTPTNSEGTADPNNNWTNQIGKYLTLRPRPRDHALDGNGQPLFPYPEDPTTGCDVKNLTGFPGGMDSIWIDIGAPVMTTADGRKFKMLVAPLILDMDGRVNLNAHGNIRGKDANGNPTHASNQGLSKTEVNLGKVLTVNPVGATIPEWLNLFTGIPGKGLAGKYGNGAAPAGSVPVYSVNVPFYTFLDPDGCNELNNYAPSSKVLLASASAPISPFPFPPPPPPNGTGYGNGNTQEWTGNPALYNPLNPFNNGGGAAKPDKAFAWSEMEAILRHAGTNSPALTSDLQRLLPNNLGSQGSGIPNASQLAMKIRNMVTTHSFHLDRPAATPWIWLDTTGSPSKTPAYVYNYPGSTANPTFNPFALNYPQQDPTQPPVLPFPPPANRATQIGGDFDTPPPVAPVNQTTWRNNLNQLLARGINKVDLNRRLTNYYDTTKSFPDSTQASPANLRLDATPAQLAQALQAITDRQKFASDIFAALQESTGVYVSDIKDVNNPAGTIIPATSDVPSATAGISPLGDQRFEALRWLAQLSVNIVDFIDSDDYITPFNWYTVPANSSSTTATPAIPLIVFGTELPRVVLNEIYSELRKDTANPAVYDINFYLELLDPMTADPANLVEAGAARLYMPPTATLAPTDYSVYQVYVTQNKATPDPVPYLRQSWNTAGNPDLTATFKTQVTDSSDYTANGVQSPQMTTAVAGKTADPYVVLPNGPSQYAGANGMNNGFYLLGPAINKAAVSFQDVAAGADVPASTLSINYQAANPTANPPTPTKGLTIQVPQTAITLPFGGANPQAPDFTVVLRRLACPNLPPSAANPYVTVDYVEHVQVNDAAVQTNAQPTQRFSLGRRQPYAAHTSEQAAQNPSQAPPTAQPKHTLFRHNAVEAALPISTSTAGQTLTIPFDWLTHADRKLISPMELLHVAAYKPHELTQQFMLQPPPVGGAAQPPLQFFHRAPWYDQTSRLYRFLEFAETPDNGWGIPYGGRVPGRININTVFPGLNAAGTGLDLSIFEALCDASDDPTKTSNYFTQTGDVDPIFTNLISKRTPGLTTTGLGINDHPVLPMSNGYYNSASLSISDGQYPNNLGINDTLLQLNTTGTQPLFDPQTPTGSLPVYAGSPPAFGVNALYNHPFIQKSLLNKIYNNITTRSNVFAVFLTVGFFEVKDDTTRPVKLGAEVGKSEGRNIRHRMFAIVDRSNLQASPAALASPPSALAPSGSVTDPTKPNVWTITVNNALLTDPRTGSTWAFQNGMVASLNTLANPNNASVPPVVTASGPGNPILPLNSEENAVIYNVNNNGAQTTFNVNLGLLYSNTTGNPFAIKVYGNPGPWTKYDPRQDTQVVPYFSIID
ncbi:MAG: hypothetical protein ACJ8FY_04865 [Gemmataceae bacterium]